MSGATFLEQRSNLIRIADEKTNSMSFVTEKKAQECLRALNHSSAEIVPSVSVYDTSPHVAFVWLLTWLKVAPATNCPALSADSSSESPFVTAVPSAAILSTDCSLVRARLTQASFVGSCAPGSWTPMPLLSSMCKIPMSSNGPFLRPGSILPGETQPSGFAGTTYCPQGMQRRPKLIFEGLACRYCQTSVGSV